MSLLALVALVKCSSTEAQKKTEEPLYTTVHTDKEWREILTPSQYKILRRAGTEYPFTSPLNNEKRPGLYYCAADSTHVFNSDDKFNSGTGWPSFDTARNVEYEWDGRATEIRCITCGSHLGHRFNNEGFTEKNARYCINGDALIFIPD